MPDRKKFTFEDLKLMNSAMIPNSWAAEILRIKPDRLAEYARTGQLKWSTLPSGNRILHSRIGLIRFLEGGYDHG